MSAPARQFSGVMGHWAQMRRTVLEYAAAHGSVWGCYGLVWEEMMTCERVGLIKLDGYAGAARARLTDKGRKDLQRWKQLVAEAKETTT